MNFTELLTALAEAGVEPRVYFAKYASSPESAPEWVNNAWNIVANGDQLLVGYAERGGFFIDTTFANEDAACEYIYRQITSPMPAVASQTSEEKQRSRSVTDAENERIRRLLDAGS